MYATAAIAAVITIEEDEEETEKIEKISKTEERRLIQRCLPLQSVHEHSLDPSSICTWNLVLRW